MNAIRRKKKDVGAVVAYAALLRRRADKIQAGDIWARPYRPSEAAARKLSQRLGPEQALKRLGELAAARDLKYREDEAIAKAARERHERRLKTITKLEQKERALMPFGRRIDVAMAKLAMLSAIPAATLEVDQISGRTRSGGPLPDDLMPRMQAIARVAAEALERELDNVRRVAVMSEANRDVRLLELTRQQLTPEQISVHDPSLGSPTQIRARLRELS